MENINSKTESDNSTIVKETVEKLKGKNYVTIVAILQSIKDNIETHLTLN